MTGPHALWTLDREGREPSAVKVARVRQRMTLADLAGRIGYSVAQVHRCEVNGRGSTDLRRRLSQALGIGLPPARGNGWLMNQLLLPGMASS
jgi:hypothetical protein